MRIGKIKIMAVMVIAAVLMFSLPAFAADILVRSVTVGMSGSGGTVGEVYSSNPVCYATDFYDPLYAETSSYRIDTEQTRYSKDFDAWQPGESVLVTVVISAKEGYRFSSADTSVYGIGNNVRLEKKEISSRQIKVKLRYWPSVVLPAVDASTIEFDANDEYRLRWEPVLVNGEKWKNYEIRIMAEDAGSKSVQTKKVNTYSADLSDVIFGRLNTIAIRSIGGSASKERYTVSSDWVVMDSAAPDAAASVKGTFSGSGDKLVYLDEAGNMISGWLEINGCWYYFDPANKNRAMVNRFAQINGAWYYFGENGVMKLGWVQDNGYWYYMHPVIDGSEGKMETGWVSTGPNGPWYYLNDGSVADYPLGAMLVSTVTPDGYTVDATGKRTDSNQTSQNF